MSVYKELFWVAEKVEKQSIRIYPDACDYGVPIFSNTDKIIKDVKSIIDQYEGKVETLPYETGCDQTIKISGYDEGSRSGKLITFTFTYVFTKEQFRSREMKSKGMIGYLNVTKD